MQESANNNVANSGYLEIISFHLGRRSLPQSRHRLADPYGSSIRSTAAFTLVVSAIADPVIPVIDMAIRLGLKPIEPTERSAIIVTNIAGKLVGLLVENVSDMITVNESELQPAPDVLPAAERALTRAIIPVDEQMICYLDLDALFSTDEELAA